MMIRALSLLSLLALAACVDDHVVIDGCEPLGDMRPVCGVQTPEDIAALPDGRHLLLSHFGGMHDGRGGIGLFDTLTEIVTPLYPGLASPAPAQGDSWGAPGCAPPLADRFSPHGTHLHQLADGRWRYLVVNHAEREAVEMFEVLGEGGGTRLLWRGCVPAAQETFINDVVGLSSGDIVFTRMFHRNDTLENVLSFIGFDTGDLWRWSRDGGLRVLPGTEANQPNGIEIAADEQHVFANMYFTGEVWKVDVDTGEVVSTAPVPSVDNSAWGSDGRLWLVAHRDSPANLISCFEDQDSPCGAGFEIVALHPQSMAFETVFAHRGPPMGAATVAVPQAGRIYLGSFVGERLVSIPDFNAP